jgi:hypothetical protein
MLDEVERIAPFADALTEKTRISPIEIFFGVGQTPLG